MEEKNDGFKATIIYKITVTGWEKHNPKTKSSYKKSLISNNFCHDNKLGVLPLTHRWLFLGIILICGDEGRATIELNERQVRALLESSKSVGRALDALKLIQVLTYEKLEIPLILKRREVKGREVKLNETNIRAPGPLRAAEAEQQNLLPPKVACGHKTLHSLILIWNENCGKLPRVKNSNSARERKMAKIWKEQPPEAWAETVKKMATSNFCNGHGGTGWKADFDFLLKPDSWLKITEGRYDNSTSAIKTAQTLKYDNLDALERKWEEKAREQAL